MIELLKAAIDNIPKEYYSTTNPETRDGIPTGYSNVDVDLEQKFVMELYCQLRKLTEGESFILEAEIQKRIVYRDYGVDKKVEEEIRNFGIERVKPDLIYHKGQEFNAKEDQKMVIECKFGELRTHAFNKDLFKLMLYDLNLDFQTCIFLIVKNNLETVLSKLKAYKNSHYVIKDPRKIKLLIKEDFGVEIFELSL